MSLANVYVADDHALIGVDTAAGPAWSGQSETEAHFSRGRSKLLPLPHSNVVIAGRGYIDVLSGVFGYMVATGHDFDSAAAALPSMLVQARHGAEQSWGEMRAELARVDTGLDGYLVGWSQRAGSMSCVRFEMPRGAAAPTVDPARSNFYWVSPGDPFKGASAQQVVVPSHHDATLELARVQTRWGKANWPGRLDGREVLSLPR